MKYLTLIALLLTGCATINQDMVTIKDGVTTKCQLSAKGFLFSAESTLSCKSYDDKGQFIDGSESVTKTLLNQGQVMDIQAIDLKLAIKEIRNKSGKKRLESSKLLAEAEGLMEAAKMLEDEFSARLDT